MKPTADPLLLRAYAELGAGHIHEGYVCDRKVFVDGYIEGSEIWINPAPAVVDSALHEIFHRLFRHWPDAYVKGRVTRLMRRMTDDQIVDLYREYQRRKQGKL